MPFKKLRFPDVDPCTKHAYKSPVVRSKRVHFKTDHALRRDENKVEFLEGGFHNERLPFLHKKKAEHSLDLSLSIFCLLTVYFKF